MEPARKATDGRSRLPLLIGAAVVLAGIFAWDRSGNWSADGTPPPVAPAPTKATAAAGPAGPSAADVEDDPHPLARLALNDLRDTVKRPLFEKKRRPVEAPPRPAQAPSAPVVRRADPKALTLLGVLMSEDGSAIALLRRNKTGQNVRLQEGDTVDEWTIERIEADSVVLLGQGDTRVALQLFRKR
jgi:hypothetical protein